ncbi:MAG: hypothetical protein GY774_05530 [Planctomycetes bacterium]|nr:hypothetical protein [Planctomycetota bacterium]
MRNKVLRKLKSNDILVLIASGFVLKSMILAPGRIADSDLTNKAKWVAKPFSPAIHLYKDMLIRIAETGCNISKSERANWIWDIQIAVYIGQGIRGIGNKDKLYLISSDSDILKAARTADSQYAISLKAFNKII